MTQTGLQTFSQPGAPASPAPQGIPSFLPATAIRARVNVVQSVMRDVMHEGQHFYAMGVKEVKLSTGEKKTSPNFALSKSGAEVLCMTFQFAPEISSAVIDLPDDRRPWKTRTKDWYENASGKRDFRWVDEEGEVFGYYEVLSTCRVYSATGNLLAQAQGSCNSMEKKYLGQSIGDLKNTILKMSQKRAFVAAVLLASGASDIFTQDLDEDEGGHGAQGAPAAAAPSRPASGKPEAYGSSLTEKQVSTAKGHADRLKLDHDASRRVLMAVSSGAKTDARAFMDILFSKDDERIKGAFLGHPAYAVQAAPAPAAAPAPEGAAPAAPAGPDGDPFGDQGWPE